MLSDKDDEDINSLYYGIRLALGLIETPAFRKMNFKLAFKQFPGCNHLKPLSKEYWFCYLRKVTVTAFHPISTCLTGKSPKTGVVDNELKVFGVHGLRVADGSIIPFPISAHTNAVCTMIGEKASNLIKKSYNY